MSRTRILAVAKKELRDYRRNRFIVVTMAVYALIFSALPMADIFAFSPSRSSVAVDRLVDISLLYLLLIPVLIPATIAGYGVVGEREQGTLEPLLTTPIRSEELLLGKALAALVPALVIAYTVFGVFLAAVHLFAAAPVASAVFRSAEVVAQPVFTPLLAAWSIWVGLAVSTRMSDVRSAQQLTMLASLPPLALTSLMTFGILRPTFTLALILALVLLAVDAGGWRLVATVFDRERLVTGSKPRRGRTRPTSGPAPARTEQQADAATASLRLSRRWGGIADPRGNWQVEIDGQAAGLLPPRQTVELPIAAGSHTLRLRSHRRRSPLRSFEASDGQTVRFWCRGQLMWPMILLSLLLPDIGIVLRPD